ncbi:MAG: tripartite tricarboxylate transporter TctB family protein [Pseudomonadota bacterium]
MNTPAKTTGPAWKTGDVIASIFCTLIGIAVAAWSVKLDLGTPTEPQPGFFPFLSGISLFVLSALLFIYARLGRSTGTEPFGDIRRPIILVTGLLIYSLILDLAGYVIATIMLAAVVLFVMDVKKWWKVLAISLFVSLTSYILFGRFLGIDLPAGILSFI